MRVAIKGNLFCFVAMKKILNFLFENKSLSRAEAQKILTSIAMGDYKPIQIAAFITAYGMRNITVQELQGFRDAMLELCVKLDFSDYSLVDLCGTGGDGKDTFNISTLASFVVAGTGQTVAKHGNYGVSSGCGSSNVMEYLGYQFTSDKDVLKHSLDTAGICFIHAPLFNPAMKIVAPIRKELGVKTFFNMLGPLCNPSEPQNQLVGVFSLELARLYAYLYQETDKNYTILHALDGFDEISLTSKVKTFSKKGEALWSVADFGFEPIKEVEIIGGDTVASSAKIFVAVLDGRGTDAQNNVVLCNAAMALQTIDNTKSFADCFYEAEESLLAKKALKSFRKLLSFNEIRVNP
ncbi:anthranilate phosphoribosyltransferase [Pedobacter sp. CG_S7]